MSKYQSYPEYKDSGVKWLGDVPQHWHLIRLKNTVDNCVNGYWGDEPDGSKDDIPVIRVADFNRNAMSINYPIETLRAIEQAKRSGRLLRKGDLLLEKSGGGEKTPVGAVVLFDSDMEAISANFIAKMTPSKGYDSSFLVYLHASLYSYGINQQNTNQTTGIQNINSSAYLAEHVFSPPHGEQLKIVNFLDRETTRIDTLIQKKTRFIELLKEKRQALISHVVTKGLDPNVPMKDSGVEWLGNIPASWELTKLRYAGVCQNGINISGEAFGSGFPFISYGDVYNNRVLPTSANGLVQSSDKDRSNYSVQEGDVLFTRTSETIEEIGFSSACKFTIPNAVFAGFLIRFRAKKKMLNVGFSEYYFQNEKLRSFFVKEMNLITRASLSQELLKRMPVVLPSIKEQIKIADYLTAKTKHIDSLSDKINTSINLLKEHRTALISAAVAGKIDVRNHAGSTNNNLEVA